ncbi:MAG TPA: hypothetical protein VJ505_00635 [Holophagaceae bacterium]|nr:hypothetical protein [Holophagaceae bacterium]
MPTALLVPLVCLSIHASDPWTEAQASFRKEVQPGYMACLVFAERLDATTLRLRVVAKDMRIGFLEGEPLGYPAHSFKVRAPHGSSDLRLVTVVPEGATSLRLRLQGDDVSPEVLVPLPKPGGVEPVILQFEAGSGSTGGVSKSR